MTLRLTAAQRQRQVAALGRGPGRGHVTLKERVSKVKLVQIEEPHASNSAGTARAGEKERT